MAAPLLNAFIAMQCFFRSSFPVHICHPYPIFKLEGQLAQFVSFLEARDSPPSFPIYALRTGRTPSVQPAFPGLMLHRTLYLCDSKRDDMPQDSIFLPPELDRANIMEVSVYIRVTQNAAIGIQSRSALIRNIPLCTAI